MPAVPIVPGVLIPIAIAILIPVAVYGDQAARFFLHLLVAKSGFGVENGDDLQ